MSDSLRERVPRLAALAAQALGWTPDAFWAATPSDLAHAFTPPDSGGAALTRSDLERMMKGEHDG